MTTVLLKPTVIILLMAINVNSINSEKILFLNAFASKSMKNFYEPLVEELANRGHDLTVVSPFKASNKHKKIRDIVGPDVFSIDENIRNMSTDAFEQRKQGSVLVPLVMIKSSLTMCRVFHETPEIKAILNEKFDLIVASYTWNECVFGFIHHLGAPFILMHANQPLPYNNPTGLPYPLSFLALPFFSFTDDMDFVQRTMNIGLSVYLYLLDKYERIPDLESIHREYLGVDTPSVEDIARNVSLIIANSHFSLNFPRPTMPDVIELGGMHCKPAKELPADLKKFAESSGDDGFILFSMGSVIKGSMMPEETRKIFLSAFSKIKQKVLWKWETETMEGLPKNVKLNKWLPQQDVLGHKNIRAFITHGGLHSTEEAIYHGVPLIGIPILGDQDSNMKLAEHFGFATTLEFFNITEEKILGSINKVIQEPIYQNNAKKISSIFRDRIQSPLENAVFHVEYVLRHKGALHLRSPARHLNFLQYHSLDIIAVLLAISTVVLTIIYFLLRILLKGLCKLALATNVVNCTKAKPLGGKADSKKKQN